MHNTSSVWPPPPCFASPREREAVEETCLTHLPSCHSNTFEAVNMSPAAPSPCTLEVTFQKLVMKVFSKHFSALFLPHRAWGTSCLVCTAVRPQRIILLMSDPMLVAVTWCKPNPLPHGLGFVPAHMVCRTYLQLRNNRKVTTSKASEELISERRCLKKIMSETQLVTHFGEKLQPKCNLIESKPLIVAMFVLMKFFHCKTLIWLQVNYFKPQIFHSGHNFKASFLSFVFLSSLFRNLSYFALFINTLFPWSHYFFPWMMQWIMNEKQSKHPGSTIQVNTHSEDETARDLHQSLAFPTANSLCLSF